jgi:hypothetical protein
MKSKISSRGLGIVLGLSLASGLALADPVVGAGEFFASGTANVSATTLDFGLDSLPPPGDQLASINLPTTGTFSYLTAGTQIGIGNLNLSSATVTGTNISFGSSEPDWISLPANTGGGLPGIDLSLNNIAINTTIPVCTGTAADNVNGNSCRASTFAPIILEQTLLGVTAILNLSGDAYYVGGSPSTGTAYTAVLDAPFTGDTITDVLSTFFTTGSVTHAFQAEIITTPSTATPEPGTVTALGAGLLLVGLINKKKNAKRKI